MDIVDNNLFNAKPGVRYFLWQSKYPITRIYVVLSSVMESINIY